MTRDQLRIFIAVAEREPLTRAAEALNLTPSAVSAAIHALETRYGVHLFHRIGRRIELSQTGRLFLVEAKATQRSARLAELALTELGGLQRGTLTIQASQTIASYWLPPFLVGFGAAHPANRNGAPRRQFRRCRDGHPRWFGRSWFCGGRHRRSGADAHSSGARSPCRRGLARSPLSEAKSVAKGLGRSDMDIARGGLGNAISVRGCPSCARHRF